MGSEINMCSQKQSLETMSIVCPWLTIIILKYPVLKYRATKTEYPFLWYGVCNVPSTIAHFLDQQSYLQSCEAFRNHLWKGYQRL